MVKVKVNIFNVIAAISSLLLVIYAWLMFLPMFEGIDQYYDVRNIVIIISVLLIGLACFQLYVAVLGKEEKEEIQSSETEKE